MAKRPRRVLRLSSSSGIFRRERDLPLFSQSITQLVDRTQTSPLVPPDSRTNMGRWRQEHPVVLGDHPGLGCTFTSHRLRPPDPLCLQRPPPSSLLLPLPRPIIRSSSGEIGNLTRGRRCKCMRFLERARRIARGDIFGRHLPKAKMEDLASVIGNA